MRQWSDGECLRGLTRGCGFVIAVLIMVMGVAVLLPGETATVHARRYGGRSYNYAAIIARCKARCGRAVGAINACRGRSVKSARNTCIQAFKAAKAACVGDKPCRVRAKGVAQSCVQDALAAVGPKAKAGRCPGCCQRSRGQGGCLGYVGNGNRFYGSYRYRGRLACEDSLSGSPSPAIVMDYTDSLRTRAAEWLRSVLGLGAGAADGTLPPGGDR